MRVPVLSFIVLKIHEIGIPAIPAHVLANSVCFSPAEWITKYMVVLYANAGSDGYFCGKSQENTQTVLNNN
jgi:hypothetical protein